MRANFMRNSMRAHTYRLRLLHARAFSSGYVQDTIIPTYHFQKSLMRLPIPKFDDTLSRYLLSVEPVVTPAQFEETKKAVEDFRNGVGPILHDILLSRDRANKQTSYINQWWLEMYLKDRQPIPINYNPQIKLKEDPVAAKNQQNQRAASLIASTVRFYRTLRDLKMEPDIFHTKPQYSKTDAFKHFCKLLPQSFSFYGAAAFGAYPLDMSQYKNLFNSTRIPNIGQDELKLSIGSKHIVVQRGSKFYKFDVLRDDGKNVPDEEILANIDAILKEPLVVGTDKNPGVGILTTMNRDNWAKARGNITKCSALNIATLEAIDSAIFVVCLEHTSPETRSDVSRTFLVGDGSNHWFDKSFQLIVAKNGMASVNFEHAWGDGVAVLRYLNEMYGDSVKYPVLKSSSPANPKELKWEFDAQTSQTLKDAKKDFDTVTSRLLIESADIPVTRKQIATHNIGVDGVMQMAIQLAHFKLHQKFVSTYESASTAAFKHGRTETVRSCTNEAVSFVKTMIDPAASDAEKEKALRTAVKKHGELTKNGVMGQGFDRHMFALKAIAGIEKFDIPDIFTIPSAQIMSKIILSTSTLSSPCLEGGSFGPVNDECYGIGYGIEGEGSVFQLSSYKSDLAQLRELLYESMLEMESLLSRSASK